MPAWPAKGKLVKLARLVCPGREPNSRPGAVTTVTLAIQVAAQIGGYRAAAADQSQSLSVIGTLACRVPADSVSPLR
jgi:hypothetical protein